MSVNARTSLRNLSLAGMCCAIPVVGITSETLVPAEQSTTSTVEGSPAKQLPVSRFRQLQGSGEPRPQLYRGQRAKPENYRALFFDPTTQCTVVIVGVRAAITAAHCLGPGPDIVLERPQGLGAAREYHARCQSHPSSAGNPSADIALCKLREDASAVAPFETIELATDWLSEGHSVWLLGYGCYTQNMQRMPPLLAEGKGIVHALPTDDRFTALVQGGVALCPGDSGGPTFYPDGKANRRLVAVNSSVFAMHLPDGSYLIPHHEPISSVAALAQVQMAAFIRDWSGRHPEAGLCGVRSGAASCR